MSLFSSWLVSFGHPNWFASHLLLLRSLLPWLLLWRDLSCDGIVCFVFVRIGRLWNALNGWVFSVNLDQSLETFFFGRLCENTFGGAHNWMMSFEGDSRWDTKYLRIAHPPVAATVIFGVVMVACLSPSSFESSRRSWCSKDDEPCSTLD